MGVSPYTMVYRDNRGFVVEEKVDYNYPLKII